MKEWLIFNPVSYERRFEICKKTNTLVKQISVNFKSISFRLKKGLRQLKKRKLLENLEDKNCKRSYRPLARVQKRNTKNNLLEDAFDNP